MLMIAKQSERATPLHQWNFQPILPYVTGFWYLRYGQCLALDQTYVALCMELRYWNYATHMLPFVYFGDAVVKC